MTIQKDSWNEYRNSYPNSEWSNSNIKWASDFSFSGMAWPSDDSDGQQLPLFHVVLDFVCPIFVLLFSLAFLLKALTKRWCYGLMFLPILYYFLVLYWALFCSHNVDATLFCNRNDHSKPGQLKRIQKFLSKQWRC